MKTKQKRAILYSGLSLVVLLAAGLGGLAYLALATPSWMPDGAPLSPEDRAAAAGRAEQQLLQTREFAAAAVAAERQARASATAPVPPGARRVEFTQDELNSVVEKWSEFRDWRKDYERYFTDPTIVLRKDRVIFAGRLRGYGDAVTSVHLRPEVTGDGRVRFAVEQVVLGTLPIPTSMYHERFGALAERVRRRLPQYQALAAIDADGMANAAALVAAVGRMAVQGLDAGSTEVPLILPMLTEPGGVPVRVAGLHVEAGKLQLDVQTLDPDQRAAAIEYLKSPLPEPGQPRP